LGNLEKGKENLTAYEGPVSVWAGWDIEKK
jgi:hypothetical protein